MPNIKLFLNSFDVSSRRKRRMAVSAIISSLARIRDGEKSYMERIPENFQSGDAYYEADCTVEIISEAIDLLMDAF